MNTESFHLLMFVIGGVIGFVCCYFLLYYLLYLHYEPKYPTKPSPQKKEKKKKQKKKKEKSNRITSHKKHKPNEMSWTEFNALADETDPASIIEAQRQTQNGAFDVVKQATKQQLAEDQKNSQS